MELMKQDQQQDQVIKPEIFPPFVGEIFKTILKRERHYQEYQKKMVYTDSEIAFWIQIRTRAPAIYDQMIQQFGAPSDGYIRRVKYQLQRDLNLNQSKLFDTELAKSLECYCEQTYKYKSRFLIGEMLILKRIYIENQDATIPQICELFQKETQMAISAYTTKRILEGLNVGKNHVINKYLLDKGVDIDFKW
ncbi:Hypothetical_protein [Hexamita inflata]|uniref:Hypothetical_protein n=1 Tax=Hexamita inflata TaxID=28002 RepID=A0AA86PW88_9EUKA|nr:Hypothetical protein HINF_LOCUS33808 [Hexamita inflata]